ncbi:hypothetical protein [Endozoicomonas arenosclerae]|uniref:hypothetical protein n=1 Tax=Endozoicomonas arenosclerae TaxID=1633495 RepID=UPI0007809488|nr:hypothetical protein [Endozoicomonas arenosclerae]
MEEYTHVVIDKKGVGLDQLKQKIASQGLLTAEASGYAAEMAEGSRRLEHHLNVFLWDRSIKGEKGRLGIVLNQKAPDCFTVRVRCPYLTRDGYLFSGTLKGDNGHAGKPTGLSINGAWAYKGNIPARFCFIEGLHSSKSLNYASWFRGDGW